MTRKMKKHFKNRTPSVDAVAEAIAEAVVFTRAGYISQPQPWGQKLDVQAPWGAFTLNIGERDELRDEMIHFAVLFFCSVQ